VATRTAAAASVSRDIHDAATLEPWSDESKKVMSSIALVHGYQASSSWVIMNPASSQRMNAARVLRPTAHASSNTTAAKRKKIGEIPGLRARNGTAAVASAETTSSVRAAVTVTGRGMVSAAGIMAPSPTHGTLPLPCLMWPSSSTAGAGEHAAAVRAESLAGLEPWGIAVEPARNNASSDTPRIISPSGARVSVCVVPTDEETAIAEDVATLLDRTPTEMRH